MTKEFDSNPIVIYEGEGGITKVEVRLSAETVWLSLNQMTEIFERDKSVISRHLKNIFTEGELEKESTVAFFATVQHEGGHAILSVGYRVNSKRGVRFRRWSSQILKDYLISGYSLNKDKLVDDKIKELQGAIDLLSKTLVNNELVTPAGKSVVEIIKSYSKTWDLLIRYDEDRLVIPNVLQSSSEEVITYNYVKEAIAKFKSELKAFSCN